MTFFPGPPPGTQEKPPPLQDWPAVIAECGNHAAFRPAGFSAAERDAYNAFGVIAPPGKRKRAWVVASLRMLARNDTGKFHDTVETFRKMGELDVACALDSAFRTLQESYGAPPLASLFDKDSALAGWRHMEKRHGPGAFDAETMYSIEHVAASAFRERVLDMKVAASDGSGGMIVHDANNALIILHGEILPKLRTGGRDYLLKQIDHYSENAGEISKYSPLLHAMNAADGYIRTNVLKEYTLEALEDRRPREAAAPGPARPSKLRRALGLVGLKRAA